ANRVGNSQQQGGAGVGRPGNHALLQFVCVFKDAPASAKVFTAAAAAGDACEGPVMGMQQARRLMRRRAVVSWIYKAREIPLNLPYEQATFRGRPKTDSRGDFCGKENRGDQTVPGIYDSGVKRGERRCGGNGKEVAGRIARKICGGRARG